MSSAPRLRSAGGAIAMAGVLVSAMFGIVLAIGAFAVALRHERFELFRVADRRGDDVTAAGPLAEIDGAATLGAEREILVAAQNELAADGTTQARDSLAWHRV